VKFWVASAIVPLLVAETTTERLQALGQRDPDMLAWWGSAVGCASALARLERDAALDPKSAELPSSGWGWSPTPGTRSNRASPCAKIRCGFFRVHALRAADALQLAAAFVAAERRPASLQVVTLDDRLADAMRREGFALVDIAAQ
jgi:uncharacterized protein